jgi:putative aldouronate transport system permease protein
MSTSGSAFLGNTAAQIANMGKDSKINYMSLNYALTVAVIMPIMVIYPFCQKYFVKGVMVGSLKG